MGVTHPPCFDTAADYEAWVKASEDCSITRKDKPPVHYCTDCLPDYQRKMLEQDRCSYPTVKFYRNGKHSFIGRRQDAAEKEAD